jgi:hypothetical protein
MARPARDLTILLGEVITLRPVNRLSSSWLLVLSVLAPACGGEVPSGVTDGGAGSDAGSCTALSIVPSSEIPPYVVVQPRPGACTAAQITAGGGSASFVDSCFVMTATQTNCTRWQGDSANATCAGCLFGSTDAGAWSRSGGLLLDYTGKTFVGGNLPGCIALADPSKGPACAAEVEPVIACEAAACSSAACLAASPNDYRNCISKSLTGACAAYRGNFAACAADYADGGVGTTRCGRAEEAFNVICGKGP